MSNTRWLLDDPKFLPNDITNDRNLICRAYRFFMTSKIILLNEEAKNICRSDWKLQLGAFTTPTRPNCKNWKLGHHINNRISSRGTTHSLLRCRKLGQYHPMVDPLQRETSLAAPPPGISLPAHQLTHSFSLNFWPCVGVIINIHWTHWCLDCDLYTIYIRLHSHIIVPCP